MKDAELRMRRKELTHENKAELLALFEKTRPTRIKLLENSELTSAVIVPRFIYV